MKKSVIESDRDQLGAQGPGLNTESGKNRDLLTGKSGSENIAPGCSVLRDLCGRWRKFWRRRGEPRQAARII